MMSTKEMMERAKRIYKMDEFRGFMRRLQNLTDEDFKKPVPRLKQIVLGSSERDPIQIFHKVLEQAEEEWTSQVPIPVNNEWHHFIVPGVVLAALRNNGYAISDEDIEEGMRRGERFPGGSCGFMGTCGGAYSVGIVASLVKRTTPLHCEERQDIMQVVAETLKMISQIGRRCCKRSSYTAIRQAVFYLGRNGYELPLNDITCRYSSRNTMCAGAKCPYNPKSAGE